MSKRSRVKKKLQTELDVLIRQYGRKAAPGWDPNDRGYDRDVEAAIKRMDPVELDRLLRGEDEDDADSEL